MQRTNADESDLLARPGMTREVWDYVHSEDIAHRYDRDHFGFALFDLDTALVREWLPARPDAVALDLGCGTGRTLLTMAQHGLQAIGVDLSPHMLRLAQSKLTAMGLLPPRVRLFRADITRLDFLDDASVDFVTCLYSTFGLIAGRDHRVACLRGVARVMAPGAVVVLHVHNRYYPWYSWANWRWLLNSWMAARTKECEFGDQFYDDYLNAIPRMFLHTFGPLELRHHIEEAGLEFVECRFVHHSRRRFLRRGLFRTLRSHGLFAIGRKPVRPW